MLALAIAAAVALVAILVALCAAWDRSFDRSGFAQENWTDKAKDRPKRDYIEKDGQFDALFSFNLRTPPSSDPTLSGKKIHTLSFAGPQPDALVTFIRDAWKTRSKQG